MQFAINIRWDERTMKMLFRTLLKFGPALVLLIGAVATTMAQGAKLQLDQLDILANKASETIDVKLDEHLMQTTAKFFSSKDTDDAEIRDLIKNVKGIYVKSFTFEKNNEYTPAEVDSVMSQLKSGGRVLVVFFKRKALNVDTLDVLDQVAN